jgi:phosphoribosylanthranilate isomerase
VPRNGIEPPTRLKVCCIESEAEARLAVHLGASALGLVSSMPSGPGVITAEAIDPPGLRAPHGCRQGAGRDGSGPRLERER